MGNRDTVLPHVVVVGGGFGGLAAARALNKLNVRVTLVDRTNHHVFQPLLYQVATALLTPGQVGAPIRQVLKGRERTSVLCAEVNGVDCAAREIIVQHAGTEIERIPYDFLILSTGVRHSYFGRGDLEPYAPGLKTLADATMIRNRILTAFENAEGESDPARQQADLTFVLVGGGPTGVEMAGSIAELARLTLTEEFRRFDPRKTRIVLAEAGPRILSTFDARLAAHVAERLREMGVEVRTGSPVEQIDDEGVTAGGERIAARTVIWTAGVEPTPAANWLGARTDRAGRVIVRYDLSVPDHEEIFVIGDAAYFEQDGKPLPGVAQVALQMGRHVVKVIAARLLNGAPPPAFRYADRGNMAVVGRNYAILDSKRIKLHGRLAWLLWSTLHVAYLALPNMRLSVFLQWIWAYFTRQHGSRLIVEPRCPAKSASALRNTSMAEQER
jgi:NADH:ubiquinone reductase (H+-translocating)